jgi:predicted naringenin-chalcone synthase
MTFAIQGIGTAVPEHTMSQAEATELAHQVVCRDDQQRRLLSVLYRKAGVENRYTALPHRTALQWMPPAGEGGVGVECEPISGPTTAERMKFYAECAPALALEAATRSLEEAKLKPSDITHLVTVSCTGFDAPGVDIALIDKLGLRPTTQRVQVGFMGCHGAINGLRVAKALAESDPKARVLLCAVELCSLHYRFLWDPQRIVANALFADGAAAVVGWDDRAAPRDDAWRVAATGSCLIPASQDAMSWRIGDHGFEMTLDARVPDLIREHLRPWLAAWLDSHGLSVDKIASWAVHPGGPRILGAIEESLGLAREQTAVSRDVLARHGNMSSPTVVFIVNQLRQAGAPKPCVALGFGPGLMAEAALFA